TIYDHNTSTYALYISTTDQVSINTTSPQVGYQFTSNGGIYGSQSSSSYAGVQGVNSSVSGTGYGGLFSAATTGAGYGVYSSITGTGNTGYAVYGYNTATSSSNYGVGGRSDSTSGVGVQGFAPSGWYGVTGEIDSNDNGVAGVFGFAFTTTGNNKGVIGQTNSTGNNA